MLLVQANKTQTPGQWIQIKSEILEQLINSKSWLGKQYCSFRISAPSFEWTCQTDSNFLPFQIKQEHLILTLANDANHNTFYSKEITQGNENPSHTPTPAGTQKFRRSFKVCRLHLRLLVWSMRHTVIEFNDLNVQHQQECEETTHKYLQLC